MGPGRRRLVSLLGALLLFAFVPRLAAAAEHEHLELGAKSDCAACIVGHAPGLEAAPVEVAPAAPLVAEVRSSDAPATVVLGSFAYAAPLACGPPA